MRVILGGGQVRCEAMPPILLHQKVQSMFMFWFRARPSGFRRTLLRVERAVVVAHASVVATDDQVRAAVVLAEQGVQQCLARTGITHIERVTGLDHGVGAK